MKKRIILTLIATFLIYFSFSMSFKIPNIENTKKEFVILGEIKNGNGKELALIIPSLGGDKRLKTKIKNDKFEFKVRLNAPEKVFLTFEKEYKTGLGYYVQVLFLSCDTTRISAEIGEAINGTPSFSNVTFSNCKVNQYFLETAAGQFNEAFSGFTFSSDSLKQDSIRINVYPKIRKRVLDAYEKLCAPDEYSIIGLYCLRYSMEYASLFDLTDLSIEEKNKLIEYFENIDTNLNSTPDYIATESFIKRLRIENPKIQFVDYSIQNELGQQVKLSNIIKENKFTVLYFWWSFCSPCRKFIQESQNDYIQLKSKGIEIVGINTDEHIKQWEKASKKDKLKWINLYMGRNTSINGDYNVIGYPTKIVVDNEFNIIDFKFKDANELLKLLE